MNNKFKVGDKVKCVDGSIEYGLEEGAEYVIASEKDGHVTVYDIGYSFNANRFKLISTKPTTNIPTGCKPFNYEEAKQNLKNICNEFGVDDIIKSIHKVHNSDMFVAVDNEDDFHLFNMDGTAVHEGTASLFLLKDETVVYVNVSESGTGVGYMFKDMAIRQGGGSYTSIAALTISNGEVIKTETVHRY